MEIWIASSNAGKIREFEQLFADMSVEIHGQNELSYYSPPEETGKSFEENARLKAKSLSAVKPNAWVVADDSGLVCEGLNGMPGIYSARYAGDNASDAENTAKLLKMIQLRTDNRKAYFVCCLVCISPSGEEFVFEKELHGVIAKAQRGTDGFGYDPIFIPEGYEQSLAELGKVEKNKLSHRAQAIKSFREQLNS